MHQPGIRPPVRHLGVETPEVQKRRQGWRPDPGLPHPINPPQAQPLPTVGDKLLVGAPPLFRLGGEHVGLRQLKHLHPHFEGGGGAPTPMSSPAPATHVATPTTR